MTGFNSKRRMAQAKLDDDDDTQVYADTLLIVYQRGFADGKAAAEQEPCVGKDPRCPCQDGGACHYKDCGNTKARPVAQPEQGVVISAWSLREVYFDEDGEPSMHRSPPAAQPPAEWELIKNILAEYGLDAIAFVAEWKAAQRKWVGLTDAERDEICLGDESIARSIEAKLKERNT